MNHMCNTPKQHTCITYIIDMSRLPHSLEKAVPILVLQFENDPLFLRQNTDLSAQNDPFFTLKHTFLVQNEPLFFAVKY